MTIQQNYPAIKPTLNLDFANTKQLDPRITYSRASTGTYYDGKTVAKAEENLLLQSQAFSSASWFKFGIVATADTTVAPDGTSTADTLTPTASAGRHITYQSYATASAGQVFTLSVYVKPNGHNYVALGFEPNTNGVAKSFIFDLSSVSAAVLHNSGENVFANASATITSTGNGWFRCTMTSTSVVTLSSFLTIQFGSSPIAAPAIEAGMPTFTSDGTSGAYLWGAQLEQRSFATAYTPTTTAPITNYIPVLQTASAGTPRFDHNPITGESLGLLIEEQRTNLLTYSEQFDNAAWAKTRATITANAIAAPDGTVTADKLVENTDTNSHFINQNATVSSGIAITYSIYAKKGERNYLSIFCLGTTAASNTFFDLNTGVVVSTSTNATSSIQNIGNGWYRCTVTATTNATTTGLYPGISVDGVNASYTGNGFSGIYIWGAQLEAGAFATSYIPTVASQVTRAADSASMTGTNFSSWFNQSEGSFYFNATTASVGNRGLFFASNSANTADRMFSYGSGTALVFAGNTSASTQFAFSQVPGSLSNASALAYKVNDFAATSNGAAVATDTSGSVPPGLNQIQFGYLTNSNDQNINGTIKKIAYYPRRLTNTQISALTT